MSTPFEEAVAGVLDELGSGEVVTYGEVAAEAGFPEAEQARRLGDEGVAVRDGRVRPA